MDCLHTEPVQAEENQLVRMHLHAVIDRGLVFIQPGRVTNQLHKTSQLHGRVQRESHRPPSFPGKGVLAHFNCHALRLRSLNSGGLNLKGVPRG